MKKNWSIKLTVGEVEVVLKRPAFLPRRGDFLFYKKDHRDKDVLMCKVDRIVHDFTKRAVLINGSTE